MLPTPQPQNLAAIVQDFAAAELSMAEDHLTKNLPLRAIYRSNWIYARVLLSVAEKFFGINLPLEELEVVQTWGQLQDLFVSHIPGRETIEALYQQRPDVITKAIQTFLADTVHSPSLPQVVQAYQKYGIVR
jgi:hypothetical protein